MHPKIPCCTNCRYFPVILPANCLYRQSTEMNVTNTLHIKPAAVQFLLFYLLLSSFGASAQQTAGTGFAKALLWKIEGKQLAAPSYLYGTTHAVCSEDIHFSDSLLAVFQTTGQIFVELEPSPANRAFYREKILSLQGTSLKRLMGKKTFRKIKEELYRTMTVDEDTLNTWRPGHVAYQLAKQVYRCPIMAYDDSLVNLAERAGKPVYGLENATEHFALFEKNTMAAETEGLFRMMNNLQLHRLAFARQLEANLALYNSKDINRVFNQGAYYDGMRAEMSVKILDERNKKWIPVIEKAAKERPAFFVFGCAHLAGKNGVINLMREKGYTVTPLFY
jgi:uncharacterized protein